MGGDTNDNLQALGWNAHRHLSSPIAQPRYRFQDVPRCQRLLEGSVVQEIPNSREAFKEIMAEMVLLCTEAIKRSRSGRTAGKPLSLEYIADRLDVDDPCFGYIIRSNQGHLQGFITVTTFTNWQKSFSWDSLQEMSFYYDDACDDGICARKAETGRNEKDSDGEYKPPSTITPTTPSEEVLYNNNNNNNNNNSNKKKKNLFQTPRAGGGTLNKRGFEQKRRTRVIDEDGSLAKALEKTVRLGDPYKEGIVWPRIAEISLLGALGCGRVLVQLVIEQLEFQRATGIANYDYIALQATDNSIPFYESLGFVRVGAVCYDTKDDEDAENTRPSSPDSDTPSDENATNLIMPKTTVSSPNFVYEVVRGGMSPNELAKGLKVCVWDIIFFNKSIYPDLKPTSKMMKGTQLFVPKAHDEKIVTKSSDGNDQERKGSTPGPESPTKWFVAKENDTPRKIAKQFGIACKKLVEGNRRRLPELQATSRLRAGTRVKVSNLDQHDKVCEPYCHWSFPEDTAVEGGDPSYMMVYKLNRKTARNPRAVRKSLAVSVGKYSPPKLLFPPPPKNEPVPKATDPSTEAQPKLPLLRKSQLRSTRASKKATDLKYPKEPKLPEKLKKQPPQDGKQVFWENQKQLHPELTTSTPENEKIIKDRWSRCGNHKKERFHTVAYHAKKIYKQAEQEYKGEWFAWKKECEKIKEQHELEVQRKEAEAAASKDKEKSLFNKVIKLRENALEGKDYKYWFVLTFIPDLKWCHLAPMVQEGHFGPDRKSSHGRPRYRLVDEKLGEELDISSSFCIPVKSKALKRTADADKEEWDIHDGRVEIVREDVETDSNSIHSDGSIAIGSTQKALSREPKLRTPVKPSYGKIAIRSAAMHAQDPLKRTRASPASGRKRRIEEIRSAGKDASSTMTPPVRERKRRRCMRCIENKASPAQAVGCLGAKGRFGRDACQFFEVTGARKIEAETHVKKEEAKLRVANIEKVESTPASSSPQRPTRRPDASGSTPASPMRLAWSSSAVSKHKN